MAAVPPSQNPESELLIRDPLTGAYSRALFQTRLQEEIDRAKRYGSAFSMCVFDLDHFKSINDAYGHTRGDQVLCELVKRVQQMVRASDLLFRYGGDEFVLLLPNTPKAQAFVLTQRLLDSIQATPFDGEPPLSLSLSIGLASYPDDGESSEALFAAADQRSLVAKRQGRAQVVGTDAAPQAVLHLDTAGRLIERDTQLSELTQFLEALAAERPGVLRIVGAVGAGRTRFLAEVTTTARMRNFAVLGLAAIPTLHGQPFAALMRASWAADLPTNKGTAACAAALQQIMVQGKHNGLLIVIDNLPDLDHATLGLLRELLSCGLLESLGVVYSTLPEDARTFGPAHLSLRQTITLPPFSMHGIRILVRTMLRWEPPTHFLEWLHQTIRGLPVQVEPVLRELMTQGMLQPEATGGWRLQPGFQTYPVGLRLGALRQSPPHNLPAALTEFVGREQERTQIEALLVRQRLVTLCGPGGIGKTRLAQQVASDVLDSFIDGVWFVPLAAVHLPELVPSAIAQALGLKEEAGQSVMVLLKSHLRNQQVLLVLDNFEQVVDAAPIVTELLADCAQLKVVVTSRSLLRVYGERVFNVPPLAMPDPTQITSVDELEHYASLTLFTSRAQAVQYDFALTEANAEAVIELCRGLDGLPLAIELAAARCNEFSPAQLVQQMRRRLDLLVDGPRDLPKRQQTLRGAIDWSFTLLQPEEQRLFARLGVFVGGCTLEAIRGVLPVDHCEATLEQMLSSLVDKNLLQCKTAVDGEQRYTMLETIREYAQEQLVKLGEDQQLRQQYAKYYGEVVETAYRSLREGQQSEVWLPRLYIELANVRAVLAWGVAQGSASEVLQISAALLPFWDANTYFLEGARWLEAALALEGVVPILVKARALNAACMIYTRLGNYERALMYGEQCLQVSRTIGEPRGIINALGSLGVLAMEYGHFEQSAQYFEEILPLAREHDVPHLVAITLDNLGSLALAQGNYVQAEHWLNEGLIVAERCNSQAQMIYALCSLGWLALDLGDDERARALFADGLALSERQGVYVQVISLVEGWAGASRTLGAGLISARIFGLAEAQREARHTPILYLERDRYDRMVADVRARCTVEDFAAAWAEGRTWSFEHVIQLILEHEQNVPSADAIS